MSSGYYAARTRCVPAVRKAITALKTSAGILPAVPRASRPRRGGCERPLHSRWDVGATRSSAKIQITRSGHQLIDWAEGGRTRALRFALYSAHALHCEL